jgi:hypothetical protein
MLDSLEKKDPSIQGIIKTKLIFKFFHVIINIIQIIINIVSMIFKIIKKYEQI